jgi:4-amino-4-deoxy-L-arabinose transferase-like glycosyltransferase
MVEVSLSLFKRCIKAFKWFIARNILFLISVLLVSYLATHVYVLKTLGYAYIPAVGVTFDEYHHVWAGKSILTTGVPVSWSDRSVLEYKKHKHFSGEVNGFSLKTEGRLPDISNFFSFPKPSISVIKFDYGIGDRYINLVQPSFDHPPLAGIIYALGLDDKVKTFTNVTAEQFRRPTIWLSYATGVLIFLLMARIYNPFVGVVAFGIYSTFPSSVFSARLALAENVLGPLFLLSLLVLFLAKSKKHPIFWFGAGLLAGITVLPKFSGASAILAGLLILFYWRVSKKEFVYFIAGSALPVLAYFGYAYFLGQELFFRILSSQAARAALGPLNLYQAVERVFFKSFPLDGWWTGGLITLLYLSKFEKDREIVVAALAFVLVATVLGGDINPWYFFPLIIFFSLAYASLIHKIFTQPSIINISIFFLFPFLSTFYWGYSVFHPNLNISWIIRVAAVVFLAIGILGQRIVKNKALLILWFFVLILVLHRLYLWNTRSILYIIENWNKLPTPFMWN